MNEISSWYFPNLRLTFSLSLHSQCILGLLSVNDTCDAAVEFGCMKELHFFIIIIIIIVGLWDAPLSVVLPHNSGPIRWIYFLFDSLWYKYLRHDVFNITAAVFSCQSFCLPHPAVIINPVLLLPSMPPVPAVSLPGYLCFSVSSSL